MCVCGGGEEIKRVPLGVKRTLLRGKTGPPSPLILHFQMTAVQGGSAEADVCPACVKMSAFLLLEVFFPVSLPCVFLPCLYYFPRLVSSCSRAPSFSSADFEPLGWQQCARVPALETDHSSPEMTVSLLSHMVPVASVNSEFSSATLPCKVRMD